MFSSRIVGKYWWCPLLWAVWD
uniref:Uncharacterized protein n=1 Tax=Triticum urartu TaxID=4572 RepID=A0A8R7TBF4_TRIUA